MFRTKEEILDELKERLEYEEPARILTDILNKKIDITEELVDFYYKIDDYVEEIEVPFVCAFLKSDRFPKEMLAESRIRHKPDIVQWYKCCVADCLSGDRNNQISMQIAKEAYGSDNHLDWGVNSFEEMKENLGILESDKNCVIYDPVDAVVCFKASFADRSENPCVIFAYAEACENVPAFRSESFDLYKKAADMGHTLAKEIYDRKCEEKLRSIKANNGCTYCGRTSDVKVTNDFHIKNISIWKGIFVKRCRNCGKEKNY